MIPHINNQNKYEQMNLKQFQQTF